jgi:ABC-type hemin transport system ATPase subunit
MAVVPQEHTPLFPFTVDPNLAYTYADHIVLLAKGRVAAQGRPPDVMTESHLSQAYECPIRVASFSGFVEEGVGGAVISPKSVAPQQYISVAQ